MHAPAPTPTPTPIPGSRTRPLPRLTARAVALQIRTYLSGSTTREQLSRWAMAQFVEQDFSTWFEPAQARLLMEAIAVLIPVEQARSGDERESLERLAARLETA